MHPALPILTAILAAPIDDRISQMERELEILRQQNESLSAGLDEMRRINKSLQSSVDQLQVQQNDKWLSQERAAEIQKTVEGVLKDAETRTSLKEATTLTGYHPDRGFFIATPDGNFKLNLGGQLQLR
jgi:predicted RNase H-like nuclease (RuvC/YqgF family)